MPSINTNTTWFLALFTCTTAKQQKGTNKRRSRTDVHALQQVINKWPEVCKGCDAKHEDHEHDGQLEVGVQGGCEDLGCCQGQCQDEDHTVPEPQLRPAGRQNLLFFSFPFFSFLPFSFSFRQNHSSGLQACDPKWR